MKRSAPPARRAPLKRSAKALKRTPIKARSSAPKRTAPPRARSKPAPRRRKTDPEVRAERDAVRAAVFQRDGWRCRLEGVRGAGRCFGELSFHHRRKSGQGGTYTVENGATLCVGHNERLESDAKLAELAKKMTPPLVLDRHTARVEAFWERVDKDGPVSEWRPDLGRCWLWTGPTLKNGYCGFHVGAQTVYAHRFSLSLVEALRDGLEVDHLCRVRRCVNPLHLEQVTPAENRRRQGAASRLVVTHCTRGHEYTEANTRFQKNGTRDCKKCRTLRNRGELPPKESPDAPDPF